MHPTTVHCFYSQLQVEQPLAHQSLSHTNAALLVPDSADHMHLILNFPSQYHTGHMTQLPPSCTPIPLPVPPSQFYQNSSSSDMHPQPICQTLKPTSPHTATYVDQVQDTQYVHMPTVSTYGHLKQSHTPIFPPSITKVKPVSNLSRHQDRSTANYYPQLHTMQPGLAPPSLHTCPSTIQCFWPAHHRATQTPLHCHSQPYATHSLSGNSDVHEGELEVSSAAKRPCYTRSVYLDPGTTQGLSSRLSLSPALIKYAQYLRVCYTRTCLPENNKFPPSPSKHYINLAYIARRTQSKHESEKFKMAMVRGEIDEIAHDKGLDFSHVAETLPDGSYPQLVLVEGAPGVGKTTFAWEFCKKWGKGEFKQEYSLVILLRLRDKRIQEAKCSEISSTILMRHFLMSLQWN